MPAYTYRGSAPEIGPSEIVPSSPLQAYLYGGSAPDIGPSETFPVGPVNLTLPVITGSPVVGQVLSSSTGTWSGNPTSYTRQWKKNGVNIGGATGVTYTPVTGDIGGTITVAVTATNATGSATAVSLATSAVTGAPQNTVLPVISGTPQVDIVLSCSTGTWTGSPTSFTYQWKKGGVAIAGATGSSYTPTVSDVGGTITCTVTASNSAGSTSATSAGVGPVAAAPAPLTDFGHLPVLSLRMAFGYDATNPSPVYTTIPIDRIISADWVRGVNPETLEPETGRLVLVLDNRDRTFDPSYVSSPYYPNLVPEVRVLFDLTWNGVTYPQFSGYIEDWPQDWTVLHNTVTVIALDGWEPLATVDGTSDVPSQYSGTRIAAILNDVGFPAGSRSLDAGQSLMKADSLGGSKADSKLKETATAENGRLFFNGSGSIVFQDRHRRFKPPYTASVATLSNQPTGAELPYVSATPAYSKDRIRNDVRAEILDVEYIAEDAASQAKYWPRTWTKTLPLADANEGQPFVDYVLSQFKNPFLTIEEVVLEGQTDDRLWPVILGRELGDRVTIKAQPRGPAGINTVDVFVERMAHSWRRGRLTSTWSLSSASATQYWLLGLAGYSELGVTTRLGY